MTQSDLASRADRVGIESQRTFLEKMRSGFFDRYMSGEGLDIGFRGAKKNTLPILPGAIGVDKNYPGYDGMTLPFEDESQSYVYSSHILEHIDDYIIAIQEWYRVIKTGGHIITVVPSRDMYEKKLHPPSRWNADHKRFYTPRTLLQEFEQALPPNSYRVVHMKENYEGGDYSHPSEHSDGPYEIEVVIKKMVAPPWELK